MNNPIDLIVKKRDGNELSAEEIANLVKMIVKGEINDGQLGAFLMATFLQGLTLAETVHLTRNMTFSGKTLQWPEDCKNYVVDKHSTGGVGDKISLILTPVIAACGLKVPMISGRSLGHTGGTLDKIESIPGLKTSLSIEEIYDIIEKVGCCIVGQTNDIVPADRILYHMRDITGTVASIPLISASIISKKAAESLAALVLDVKVGRAAFMKSEIESRKLAETMLEAGKQQGLKIIALLTRMDVPIGNMIGNSLEVVESIQMLQGKPTMDDLNELVSTLGSYLLLKTGMVTSFEAGVTKIMKSISSGLALEKFKQMIICQGVESNIAERLCNPAEDIFSVLPRAKYITNIEYKEQTGYVHDIDAILISTVCMKLQRIPEQTKINLAIGVELKKHLGCLINPGDIWIKVHHDQQQLEDDIFQLLDKALVVKSDTVSTDIRTRIITSIE